MAFETLINASGDVWAVSTKGEAFEQDAVFATTFLECPRYLFLQQGDGLIVINAIEGIATYGVLGDAEDHHIPAVRARLLQVRPGIVEQIRALNVERGPAA